MQPNKLSFCIICQTLIMKRKTPQAKLPLDSDSLSSLFTIWQKNRAPPIYSNAQTGRIITLTEFLLFYAAVLLLVLGLGLTSFSLWAVFYTFQYTSIIDCSPELANLALPSAILCLPCSWIVFGVHNDKKSRKFLSIVLIILTFSTVLTVIGVYIGFTHKLHLNPNQIEKNPVFAEFTRSMKQSMKLEGKNMVIWNEIQLKLKCCGVLNYTDWYDLGHSLPKSCCGGGEGTCDNVNSTFQTGCLEIIISNLALQTCLFSGINCTALFLQCIVFVIVVGIYFGGSRNEED